MERNIVAIKPVLCEGREWYVYFSIRNPQTGRMIRKKIYEGFKNLDSHTKKRAHGQKLIAKYSKLIANG